VFTVMHYCLLIGQVIANKPC